MKFSYNYLKKLSGTAKTPEKVADLLMMHAFEVEGTERVGGEYENIVVGKIISIDKHPDADKLQVVKVDVTENGSKEATEVVCGAWNIKEGDKVPVALPGAKLPNGLEIKEAQIRGVKSSGMLCAEDELGLGNDHSGIMILDPKAEVGAPLAEALELGDTVLEIDILSNRAHDAASYVGMAREIAAIEGGKLKYDFDALKIKEGPGRGLSIKIKDERGCPRYAGAVLENIRIDKSPQWIQNVLRASGIRPINNVVDATNFVMLELGQPLHAFDYDVIKREFPNNSQLSNSNDQKVEIIVRKAKENEEIRLLDGNVKKLTSEDLVIAGPEKALAIAGVMGGEESGISETTTTIVMESANFDPAMVRKTRTRHSLLTDAVLRYEKGLDPNLSEKALARVVEILELSGARRSTMVDVYPKKVKPWTVILEQDAAEKLLGAPVPLEEIKKILAGLGMKVSAKGKRLSVAVPTFRLDVLMAEDLIEEIGRIYGYDKIRPRALGAEVRAAEPNESRMFERSVKQSLVGAGFSEMRNYSFYSQRDAGLAEISELKHLELENPQNPDQALMRISLIPNLLKNAKKNTKHYREFGIFEIGRVYWCDGSALPEEKEILNGLVLREAGKNGKSADAFLEAKGQVCGLLDQLGVKDYYFDTLDSEPLTTPIGLWHPGRTAEIKIEGRQQPIGYIGEVSPLILVNFDIHKRVAVFEFSMDVLRSVFLSDREFEPIRRYPAVERDISMMVRGDIRVADIAGEIRKNGGDFVLGAELFDVFEFPEEKKKSFAFRVTFGADDRTLQSAEVDAAMEKITAALEKNLDVEVRV